MTTSPGPESADFFLKLPARTEEVDAAEEALLLVGVGDGNSAFFFSEERP